jgi:hypothetical protein
VVDAFQLLGKLPYSRSSAKQRLFDISLLPIRAEKTLLKEYISYCSLL